jgi:hypothetical protein
VGTAGNLAANQVEFLDDPFGISPDASQAEVSEAQARELQRETVVVPAGTMEAHGPTVFLKAQCGARICALQLMADTAYLPLPSIEKLLRGIETIIVEAAHRDVAVAGILDLTGLEPATLPVSDANQDGAPW